jgi:hypothetical protein
MPGDRCRRPAARSSIAALALACAVWAPSAAAMSRPADGNLSRRLAELAKPSVRALPPARQAARLSVAPEGPGSLLREGNRVLVDVRFDHGAAAGVDALRAAGARIVNVSRRYQTVTVAAKPADLREVAGVARVAGVTEDLGPIVSATCPSGATVSEGDGQLRAAEARGDFGVDGSGVTVGILSDSFNQATLAADGSGPVATHAAEDVASADLPGAGNSCGSTTPVNVLENFVPESAGEEPADEGRAMSQIVHDLAPGASLAFASAFNGEFSFAENIERLATSASAGGAGAKVIADDVAYFDEPFFQDGPVAAAINEVTAAGVDYFTAAGNDNLILGGRDIASWEAPSFRDAGHCPPEVEALAGDLNHCMNFAPSGPADDTFGITVKHGATLTVDLQWAEPWFGVETDLDVRLLDSAGKPIKVGGFPVGSTEDNVDGEPVEVLSWENTSPEQEVRLAINRCSSSCNPEASETATPRLKFALLENGQKALTATEYSISSGGDTVGPMIFGHAGAVSATSVGAVPYDNSSEPEYYSSRGPVTHYFGPVVGTSPAQPTGKQIIPKPDIAATDCGVTTFFAFLEEGVWRFCGTSAAAPHAAAVAALMLQSNPSLSPSQVRVALTGTVLPVGSFGPDAVGAGLVNAFGAVSDVALPPKVTITRPPAGIGRNRRPTIEFTANRPATFSCKVDGDVPQPCVSPFTFPSSLSDGVHGVAVSATDIAGRVGSSAASFTVDTTRPKTFFAKHSRKLIRTHKKKVRATFRFGSNESGATFICKVDRGLLRFCGAKLSRRFDDGKHVVTVKARDAAGNVDRTPAVFHFKVKRVG